MACSGNFADETVEAEQLHRVGGKEVNGRLEYFLGIG